MAFDRLIDIIKKAAARNQAFSRRLEEAEAVARWETAVGPAIAKHSRAIRVQDKVLWVEVDHPIWKSELHHRKRQILEILNFGRPESTSGAVPRPASLGPAKEILEDILFLDPRGSATHDPGRTQGSRFKEKPKSAQNPKQSLSSADKDRRK